MKSKIQTMNKTNRVYSAPFIIQEKKVIQDENGIEKERAISKFVKVCEALSRQGFDFENIKYTKQIEIGDGEKQTIYKTSTWK